MAHAHARAPAIVLPGTLEHGAARLRAPQGTAQRGTTSRNVAARGSGAQRGPARRSMARPLRRTARGPTRRRRRVTRGRTTRRRSAARTLGVLRIAPRPVPHGPPPPAPDGHAGIIGEGPEHPAARLSPGPASVQGEAPGMAD
eukprot:gene16507-biopygen9762